MKIRITGKPLKKAQLGETFPKISMPAPVFQSGAEPARNEAPKEYFKQEPFKQPSWTQQLQASGIGPSYKQDDVNQRYQTNVGNQMQYDFSLADYHQQNPNKDSRKYNNFMQDKYNPNNKTASLNGLSALITLGSSLTDQFTNKKKQSDFDRYMRDQQNSDSLFPKVAGSRGDYVSTGTSFGMFRPDQYVVNKGMYTAEEGGENPMTMKTMKIRILSEPNQMAYGGQSGYGLDLGRRNGDTAMNESQYDSVGNTMGPVPREMANIEAEKGETVYGDIDGDGALEHMNIGGKRHTEGGTPLNVPEGSFIFSDTKKMRIRDEEILKQFGLSARPSGYTPAEIAKRYDLNKYKAIMEDPDADPISKQTAQLMVEKYNEKLALLSMVQESLKGFPHGKPQVAGEQEESMQEESMQEEQMEEDPEMRYGGYLPQAQVGIPGQLPLYNPATMYGNPATYNPGPGPGVSNPQTPIILNIPRRTVANINNPNQRVVQSAQANQNVTTNTGFVPWGGDRFENKANASKMSADEIDSRAREVGYTGPKNNLALQRWLLTQPDSKKLINELHTKYGMPKAKKEDDGYWGYRWDLALNKLKKPERGSKFACTPNGVVQLNPNNPMTGMQFGVFNTYEEALAVCQKSAPEKPKDTPVNPDVNKFKKNDALPFGYMAPDMVNMFAAAAVPPKKYLPYMAPYKTMMPDPTFYDPNRELAANAEQANIQGQYLSNFAGPQSYLANSAAVQGRSAENAANIMGKYNNLNVGVANDFSVRRSDIKNKEMLANTERANELYKGNVIANEQYSNARRQYLNNIAKTFGSAWNNRMNLGMLNAVNPMYNVDPITGRSYFKKGYDPSKLSGASANTPGGEDYWSSINAGYLAAKAKFPELSASEYLRRMTGTSTSTDSNGDGVMDSQRMSAQQLLNNGAYKFSAFGGPVMFPF